jgi:hypothetical protein
MNGSVDALVSTLQQAERRSYGRAFSPEADARIRGRLRSAAARSVLWTLGPVAGAVCTFALFGLLSSRFPVVAAGAPGADGGGLDSALPTLTQVQAAPPAQGGPRELP